MTQQPPPAKSPTVSLDVGGQRIRLAAHGNEQHLEQLATAVNKRVEEMQRSTKGVPPATLLALVALDLADELATARTRLEEAQKQASRTLAEADTRTRSAEGAARIAIGECLAEINRALAEDDAELTRRLRASDRA